MLKPRGKTTLMAWLRGAATLALCASSAMPVIGHAQSFVADKVVAGSSLAGWTQLGGSRWAMQDGLVEDRSSTLADRWLLSPAALQDIALSGRFKCGPECDAGVLLRAEKTPAGGWRGVFVGLTTAGQGVFRAELDADGRFISKSPLPGAAPMIRIAPPPVANSGPPRAPGNRGSDSPTVSLPIRPTPKPFVPNEWNSFEVLLDANILRSAMNNQNGPSGTVDDNGDGFGAFGLYSNGAAPAAFADVAYKDLSVRAQGREQVSPRFQIQRVDPFFYSWGLTTADFNRDGVADIVAGPNFYLGPDYADRRELTLSDTYSPSTDSPVFQVELAADFTGDGWPDVLDVSLNRPGKLYVNPQGEPRRWKMYEVLSRLGGELALLTDLDKSGRPQVLIYIDSQIAVAMPTADGTKPWKVVPISEKASWGQHGFGVGDVNGDGRLDVVQAQGWFEQSPAGIEGKWIYHPQAFGRAGRTAVGGSTMAVYDVNGDGLTDAVTAMEAHNAGLSWFEQKRAANGAISFVEHTIMRGFRDEGNAGGVVFSQPHGAAMADINGDGIPDFIVGKRHWSHHDGTTDPGTEGPAVLYVYKTVRDAKKPGGAYFVPELVHNRSGAGSQVVAQDLNKDGKVDLATTGDHGTFVFWNKGSGK